MSEAPRKNRKQVVEALHKVAAEMHNRMQRGEPPKMTLPVRSKTNISFDNKLGVFKYGEEQNCSRCHKAGIRQTTPTHIAHHRVY